MLLPPDVTEKIPKGHKNFFIRNIVYELDLTPLISEYSEEGRPARHPEIMISHLFCAYTDGITSSRANASKKRSKTAEKLDELIEDVEKQIADHLEKAIQTDEEEDKKYGEYLDEAMRAKMQKQESQKEYYQRQISVEPVFANLKFNLGFDRFRMRGLEKVKIEFGLMCIAHNLNRLFKTAIVTRNQRLMRYRRSQGS
jgi:hypothetical protein